MSSLLFLQLYLCFFTQFLDVILYLVLSVFYPSSSTSYLCFCPLSLFLLCFSDAFIFYLISLFLLVYHLAVASRYALIIVSVYLSTFPFPHAISSNYQTKISHLIILLILMQDFSLFKSLPINWLFWVMLLCLPSVSLAKCPQLDATELRYILS